MFHKKCKCLRYTSPYQVSLFIYVEIVSLDAKPPVPDNQKSEQNRCLKGTVARDFSVSGFLHKTVPLGLTGHCEKRFCLDSHIRLVIRIQMLLSAVCVTAQ